MPYWLATVWLVAFFYCGAIVYRPEPAVARPVASWLKTDKVQDRLPVQRVRTIAYRLDPPVAALTSTPERGLPWSCETIRKAVAGLTSEQIEQVAKQYRLSKWQRAEAKRCLKERT